MYLESEQLTIRKIKVTDASFYVQLFNDKDWIENISDKGLRTLEETEIYLKEMLDKNGKTPGLGFFTVIQKETQKAIGVTSALQRDSLDFVDVGYGFLPRARGKGFGLEATKLMLTYIKNTFNQEKVLAFTKPKNSKSQQLLKRLNFTYIGKKVIFDGEEDDVFEFTF